VPSTDLPADPHRQEVGRFFSAQKKNPAMLGGVLAAPDLSDAQASVRRLAQPIPTIATPKSAKVAGSGTALTSAREMYVPKA
jgi:hypothetical protein